MPEILTTSSRIAINGLLRFILLFFFVLLFLLLFFFGGFFSFSFIMKHCKYYFEILFYVTFVFIKENKKSINKKKVDMSSIFFNSLFLMNWFSFPASDLTDISKLSLFHVSFQKIFKKLTISFKLYFVIFHFRGFVILKYFTFRLIYKLLLKFFVELTIETSIAVSHRVFCFWCC